MKQVFDSVCAWNAARYEQEFNLKLANKLLTEEYRDEWLPAFRKLHAGVRSLENEVECLDALADITYVAMGVCWKAGCDWEAISLAQYRVLDAQANAMCIWPQLSPGFFIGGLIDSFNFDMEQGVYDTMAMIINACTAEAMYTLGLTEEQFTEAMLVVCNSNNSKSVKRVASDVKANAGDKGPFYVSPKLGLTKIMEQVHEQGRNL